MCVIFSSPPPFDWDSCEFQLGPLQQNNCLGYRSQDVWPQWSHGLPTLNSHGDLGCTFNNQVFCLNVVVKLPLTRAIKMACFVTNFTKVLALFISNNNYINLYINSLSTKVFFKTTLRLGTRFIMMGLDKTFCTTISFAKRLGNVGKVFFIV